jgi:hypothetical protein
MNRFYASKSAAVRHAINTIGPDWEATTEVFPVELPDGATFFVIQDKEAIAAASSRGSKPARRSASNDATFIGRSRIKGATKRVWDIADGMRGRPRRDILAACRKEGIASGTAATQYQRWKHADQEKAG